MTEFVYFLGRFHVLALHFPIALIVAAIAFEWLARKERFRHFEPAAPGLWAAAAVSAIVTTAFGYMHYAEGGFESVSGQTHRIFGTVVAVAATAAWLLRVRMEALYRKAQYVLAVVLLASLAVAGHSGANLTHGSTYLVEFAPQPIRTLAGLEPRRAPVTDIAQADPYLDVVRPLLARRCTQCHSDEKRQGELNLANHAAILAGGKEAPQRAVVPGAIDQSDLIRRVTLSPEHEEFMPAEGKAPLTADEIEVLRWWVAAGAPTGTTVAQLNVEPRMTTLLASAAGIGAGSPAVPAGDRVVAADKAVLQALDSTGLLTRQVARDNPALIVSAGGGLPSLTDTHLAALTRAGEHVVELDLRRSGVVDAQLAAVASLKKLTHLHLQNNTISDAGVRHLVALPALRSLNLYGNKGVTDASLGVIAKLPALERVYLWGTGVTPQGAARLRRERPELLVDTGAGPTPGTPAPRPPQT